MKKAIAWATVILLGVVGVLIAQQAKGGYLGVSTAPVDEALTRHLDVAPGVGVQVTYVDRDGPSNKIIKPHDVIYTLDGQIIVNHEQLAALIRNVHKAGDKVEIEVIRRGKREKITVTLGEAPERPLEQSQMWNAPQGSQPYPLQPFGNQHRWAFPNVPRNRGRTPLGGWEDLQDRLDDLLNHKQDVNAQFEEVQKRMQELMEQVRTQQLPLMPDPDNEDISVSSWSDFSASISTSDGDLSMTLKADKNGKHLRAERGGDVIHDGPVNTDAERAKLPEDVRTKLEEMEGSINIDIKTPDDDDDGKDRKVFQITPGKQNVEIKLNDKDSI